MTTQEKTPPPADAGPVQQPVGRPVPTRASCGDTVECDVREPHPQTHRLTLLTPEATAFANELLARPNTPWRLVRAT